MPHDPIANWEWEGGALGVDANGAAEEGLEDGRGAAGRAGHPRGGGKSAVEFDDLEPPAAAGRIRFDDVAHPPPEQRRPDG